MGLALVHFQKYWLLRDTSFQTTYLFTFGISGSCATTWEWKWGTLHQKKFCADKVHPDTDKGAKYLGFLSTRSLKTKEKYIGFAQFVYFLREVCLLFNF